MKFPYRPFHRFVPLFVSACLAGLAAGCVEAFDVPDMDTPDGKAFVRRCSLCHALPDPTRMPYSKWEKVVARMAENIRAQNVPQMAPEEREQILHYLKRNARPESEPPEHAP